jgi:hypothetical protein
MKNAPVSGMEDQQEDNFDDIAFMPRRHWVLIIGGISAAVLAVAVVLWGMAETNKNTDLTFQGNRRATDIRPRAANPLRESWYKDPASPVGTSGAAGDGASEPGVTPTSPEPIQTLSAILGTDDPRTLVGRRVHISVPAVSHRNVTTFWIGSAEDGLLVVLGRDTRGGEERQASVPPQHDIGPIIGGHHVSITGTVTAVPRAEDRYNWDLTGAQTQELKRRGVFIRADCVETSGQGE